MRKQSRKIVVEFINYNMYRIFANSDMRRGLMADWYYEENGAQRGPLSESDLNSMLVNHLLPPDTLVWTESLGSSWKPASQTHLEAAPQRVTPPPLPKSEAAPPPLPAAAAPSLGRQVTVSPIPVPGGIPTEKWAMWLACLPLILLAVEIAFVSAGFDPYGHNPQAGGLSIWTGIATIWLAYKDAKAVNNAGRNPQRKWLLPFILLMPLGYFIRRWYVAATPLTPLWICIVSAVVYVMGVGALTAQ
ncbi:DUF4339 domain-containing protein [Mesorhizobium sp. M0761]|uniref:DUF4339 domain-containing protein n=1 Tax=Mesorhizobium sp. M0761 TaxID=2956994 RepID=UPI00333774E7